MVPDGLVRFKKECISVRAVRRNIHTSHIQAPRVTKKHNCRRKKLIPFFFFFSPSHLPLFLSVDHKCFPLTTSFFTLPDSSHGRQDSASRTCVPVHLSHFIAFFGSVPTNADLPKRSPAVSVAPVHATNGPASTAAAETQCRSISGQLGSSIVTEWIPSRQKWVCQLISHLSTDPVTSSWPCVGLPSFHLSLPSA